MVGFTIRAATSAIILIVAFIWLWQYSGIKRKTAVLILFGTILFSGKFIIGYLMKITGSMDFNFLNNLSILFDPDLRHRSSLDYQPGSWNAITESLPLYLMPFWAPIKGFFMMLAPMPFWDLRIGTVINNLFFSSNYASPAVKQLFQKITAIIFLCSFPLLITSLFDVYRSDRGLWMRFPLVFVLLVSFMGFAVFGMIEARYRPMLLPFWLSVCGIGYYYGKPKRYIMPTIGILAFGAIVYLIPKIF